MKISLFILNYGILRMAPILISSLGRPLQNQSAQCRPKVNLQWYNFFRRGMNAATTGAFVYKYESLLLVWIRAVGGVWLSGPGSLLTCRNKRWHVIHESSRAHSHFLPPLLSDYCGGGTEVMHECLLPLSGLLSLSVAVTLCLIRAPVSWCQLVCRFSPSFAWTAGSHAR